MRQLIDNPRLARYTEEFAPGTPLFLEGDESRDMYILVRGEFEIYKDDKKISVIQESGSLVGEMSFLLGEKRTATVKAGPRPLTAVRIPADRIADFLGDFPELAPRISRTLAQRLQETTRVVHGLKEFCDQLPDAVIMTDKEKKILAWNRAAERLHGRTWEQMKGRSLMEVYEDPEEYRQFIAEIHAGNSLTEKTLPIKHPDGGERYVATSTTVLYDGHHNIDGFIFLGRDVTGTKHLERQYRMIRNWLIPAVAISVLLALAFFISFSHFAKGVRILDQRKESFRERISRDTRDLATLLAGPLAVGDEKGVNGILENYFEATAPGAFGISGLKILGPGKLVLYDYSPAASGLPSCLGHSYSNIAFKDAADSSFKILSLFRADADNPMGRKGVEIAGPMPQPDGRGMHWLIFQLDMERLEHDFGLDEKSLTGIDFVR